MRLNCTHDHYTKGREERAKFHFSWIQQEKQNCYHHTKDVPSSTSPGYSKRHKTATLDQRVQAHMVNTPKTTKSGHPPYIPEQGNIHDPRPIQQIQTVCLLRTSKQMFGNQVMGSTRHSQLKTKLGQYWPRTAIMHTGSIESRWRQKSAA